MKKAIITVVVLGAVIGIWLWLRQTPQSPTIETQTPTTAQTTQQEQPAPKTTTSTKTITTKEGMKIETIKEGQGSAITNGQTATVDYIGKLIDGTVFDASAKHGTTGFSFSLGAGQVIKGWDQGVLGMKAGEVRMLTIPADLAYGAGGIPGVIPPNATLIFEVTLRAIN